MSDSDNKVECSIHGSTSATFLCNHLLNGEKLGFNAGFDPEDPDDLYPDAWCNECESILNKEGEWNDVSISFSDIKIVCTSCYCNIRERNWNQDEPALKDLICDCFEYLEGVQKQFMDEFRVNDHDRWDWYQETGKLIFSHDGKPVVECDVDFVGTFSKNSETWQWAWANSSFLNNIKDQSRTLRALGEEESHLKLASALWPADEIDGWEMTAILAAKLEAIGAYRAPSDNGFVYMIVREASWVN
jgi:hypothetical protein